MSSQPVPEITDQQLEALLARAKQRVLTAAPGIERAAALAIQAAIEARINRQDRPQTEVSKQGQITARKRVIEQ